MYTLVLNIESFTVPIVPLITKCHIFQTTPALLARPHKMQSRISADSFRFSTAAIVESEATITSDKAGDLAQLGAEFKSDDLEAQVEDARKTQFPPYLRQDAWFMVPDGIVAHLMRHYHGDGVEVTSGSFEPTTYPSGGDLTQITDMAGGLEFTSACRGPNEDIAHARNTWICYAFKERMITPTHYAIRSSDGCPVWYNLKSWLVETSADGERWQEVDHKEDSEELNGRWFTRTFAVAQAGPCRFIRLVNIGRNHRGNDLLWISAWEIFGTLIE
jgi:hypothetical protein